MSRVVYNSKRQVMLSYQHRVTRCSAAFRSTVQATDSLVSTSTVGSLVLLGCDFRYVDAAFPDVI
jgi:hypothetical protein